MIGWGVVYPLRDPAPMSAAARFVLLSIVHVPLLNGHG